MKLGFEKKTNSLRIIVFIVIKQILIKNFDFIKELNFTSYNYRPSFTRFSKWIYGKPICKGKVLNDICIPSIGDLPFLVNLGNHFFANKFLLNYDPITYQCMEELYFKRAKNQTLIVDKYPYCAILKKYSNTEC